MPRFSTPGTRYVHIYKARNSSWSLHICICSIDTRKGPIPFKKTFGIKLRLQTERDFSFPLFIGDEKWFSTSRLDRKSVTIPSLWVLTSTRMKNSSNMASLKTSVLWLLCMLDTFNNVVQFS